MNNPFEVLGLKGWADQDEIRAAYRTLVKQCHAAAIASPMAEIPAPAAVLMAERALARDNPEGALRQLMKSDVRDGDWYYMQGRVLMALEQYESAHQSFREAVRRCPDNNIYRSGALAAVVAQREASTLQGKFKRAFRKIVKK